MVGMFQSLLPGLDAGEARRRLADTERGEATRSLLMELWGKHSSRDRELMLGLMTAFKLLRGLGGSGRGMCERYIAPTMLPNRNLGWCCKSRAKRPFRRRPL